MQINVEIIKSIVLNQATLKGNENLIFSGMQSVNESSNTDITWIKPSLPNIDNIINTTNASGIICNNATYQFYQGNLNSKLFIVTDDPKNVFVSFLNYIDNLNTKKKYPLIHPTAIIDENCRLGENVEVGAHCIIGNCVIGDNTVVSEYVKIYDNVTIGKNCKIREFCSIGGAGFGYNKNANQQNQHIPHIGSVLIEDNVDVFPYSNIDRGTLGKTWIKSGTVIDHYVHIGHNTTTGKNNIIAAGCVLAGGSKIEDNCFIGVHTIIKEKCEIGSNVITGMGSVVVKNIPSNQIWVGNPAKFLKEN